MSPAHDVTKIYAGVCRMCRRRGRAQWTVNFGKKWRQVIAPCSSCFIHCKEAAYTHCTWSCVGRRYRTGRAWCRRDKPSLTENPPSVAHTTGIFFAQLRFPESYIAVHRVLNCVVINVWNYVHIILVHCFNTYRNTGFSGWMFSWHLLLLLITESGIHHGHFLLYNPPPPHYW